MSDIDRLFPENRDLDRASPAKDRLCWRDRHREVEIGSVTSESSLSVRNIEGDVEITISIMTFVSFSSHLDTHAMFDSWRDIDRFLDLGMDFPLSVTVSTSLDDLLARSMTGSTRSSLFHHAKYRLYSLTYLTRSMTGGTLLRFSSLPTTVMTLGRTIKLNLATHTHDRIFERDLKLHLDIFSDITTTPPTSSSTESTAEKR